MASQEFESFKSLASKPSDLNPKAQTQSTYQEIETQEDFVDETIDFQIEELNRLKEYEYFWKGCKCKCWSKISCTLGKAKNCLKKFCKIRCIRRGRRKIHKIEKGLEGESRICLYIILMPYLVILGLIKLFIKVFQMFFMWPQGKDKRRICFVFAIMMIIATFIITYMIFEDVKKFQYKIVNYHVSKTGLEELYLISTALGQLKKADLQEIFHELILLNSLMSISINNNSLVSQDYVNYSKKNRMYSNSGYLQHCEQQGSCPDNLTAYIMFPYDMDYENLKNYAPADQEVDLCAYSEYWISWLQNRDLLELK